MTAYADLGGEFNPTFPTHVIFRQGNTTKPDEIKNLHSKDTIATENSATRGQWTWLQLFEAGRPATPSTIPPLPDALVRSSASGLPLVDARVVFPAASGSVWEKRCVVEYYILVDEIDVMEGGLD